MGDGTFNAAAYRKTDWVGIPVRAVSQLMCQNGSVIVNGVKWILEGSEGIELVPK